MPDYTIDSNINNIVITSKMQITLQVGANSIVIDETGITIKCAVLNLQAETEAQLKALMYKESVSGVKEISSALIKIG